MSEFETLTALFPSDRDPTRELEPIQKVDRTDRIERDIEEFHETDSARRVLKKTADIVEGAGLSHRFRYVHATFGSGKSHLLKLIGVATGEMEGLEQYAHDLANTTSGFSEFRDALSSSRIDHLLPLFLNLLDRDRDDTALPLILFEELGRSRGYHTSKTWLLEFCWQLDVEHGLWEQLQQHEHEGLTLEDVVDRPASLRPWLERAVPQLDGATEAALATPEAVDEAINQAKRTVDEASFTPEDLVERLRRTKRYLEQDGDVYQFLIGLDEIAIYVGDQAHRYEEVVDTVEALIDGLNPPILGTGQWSMRDMQRDFVGDVDSDAWYAQEIKLEGADTETIVRKRWLQKSQPGADYIETALLDDLQSLEPSLDGQSSPAGHSDPVEAYPFRDQDLWLLRETMQGLIKGDRETDREYIQGRALLVRVRSLFADHGWADREPGVVVPWDQLYDAIQEDTALVPGWATDLIDRIGNSIEDPLAQRTGKALFLLSQVDLVPRTPENLARLLAEDVTVDLTSLTADVEANLEEMADRNLIREEVDASPTTYTILSEEDIRFWQEVQEAATDMPDHQLRDNIQQFIIDADPGQLTGPDGTTTGSFDEVDAVSYTVRYTVNRSLPDSVTDRYDTIVVRLLADDRETLRRQRDRWQSEHSGPDGREDVLITLELTEAIRQQVRQLVGMRTVLSGMADPAPEYRLQRQTLQEGIEDTIQEQLHNAAVYTPTREAAYGSYLAAFDEVMATAVNEKFPNRKTIERSLQLGDLQDMAEFFQGQGQWPLADADADLFGVQTVPRTIDNGWTMAFLQQFEDEDRVDGEQILETIEGRRGAFLGTPVEALQALLFVLVADNRIAVRKGGERVTDLSGVARIITRETDLRDAVIEFDPEPPAEGLDDVYEALLGDPPDTDDTKELLEQLAAWVDANSTEIRTVISRTDLEFDATTTLADLETALEPAFAGDDLDADLLTNQTVIDQANLYAKVAPLLVAPADEEPLWDRFDTSYQRLADLYPQASVVKQMSPYAVGSQIPTASTLEDLLDRGTDLRVDRLQTLYHNLTGDRTETEDLDDLRAEITEALTDESLQSTLDTVEDRFEALTLATLQSIIDQARDASEPLSEASLAEESVRDEAETLASGRALLETRDDGSTLFAQLQELEADLSDTHTGFVTEQVRKAVNGQRIPDPDRAGQLIDQGHNILSGETPDDDDPDELEAIWQEIAEHDDGTIVRIDPEADQ